MNDRLRSLGDRVKASAISGVGGALLTTLMRSTRSEVIHNHVVEDRYLRSIVPCVFVLWHGRLLPCAYRYREHGLATLITRNRDGDYIAGTIERWGYSVIRGSSSRGGMSALRTTVRLLRAGTPVALTPDGPRGPRQQMKLGPLQAAQMAGVPIVPITAGASGGSYVGSWDRFLIPHPFAWIPVALGDPVLIPPTARAADLSDIATDLEATLNRITCIVDEAAREHGN